MNKFMFNSCVPLVASGKAERMAIHVLKKDSFE